MAVQGGEKEAWGDLTALKVPERRMQSGGLVFSLRDERNVVPKKV